MGVHSGPYDSSELLPATIVSSSNATDTTYTSGDNAYRVYTFLASGYLTVTAKATVRSLRSAEAGI